MNQNPTGISFNDCITNMSLNFPIALTGFAGQGLEVWAGTQDCTTDMSRGKSGTTAVCWKVAELGAMNVQTTNSTQIPVRMQNIVGPQNTTPTQTLVNETSSACYSQQSYASVQFNVAFVPVTSAGLLQFPGRPGASFPVTTDLVGPPAPTGISGQHRATPSSSSTGLRTSTPTPPDTISTSRSVAQLTSGRAPTVA